MRAMASRRVEALKGSPRTAAQPMRMYRFSLQAAVQLFENAALFFPNSGAAYGVEPPFPLEQRRLEQEAVVASKT